MMKSMSRRWVLFLSALCLAVPAVAQNGGDPPMESATKEAVLSAIARVVKSNAFVPGKDFSGWDAFLEQRKTAITETKTQSEFARAVNEELSEFFKASHIVLVTPQAAKARIERRTVGIGILVQAEEDGSLTVVSVFDDTPAKEIGLQPGDRIVEADGKKLEGVPSLLGEEGSTVTIKVLVGGKDPKTHTVTRRKYNNTRIDTLTWVRDDTALLKVHTFDISYDRKKIDALMEEAGKAKNLILDLRSNGGGVVLNMLHLLGHFLPADTKIGTFINKSMVNRFVDETKGDPTDLKAIASWSNTSVLKPVPLKSGPFKGNVAVLINGGSGSASEITAAALKETLKSPVVGTRSAGAVLVSTMAPLPEGWVWQFPLMDYLTAQGVRLEGNGIEPDVEAPLTRFGEPDVAIDRAIDLLARIELRSRRAGSPPPIE